MGFVGVILVIARFSGQYIREGEYKIRPYQRSETLLFPLLDFSFTGPVRFVVGTGAYSWQQHLMLPLNLIR